MVNTLSGVYTCDSHNTYRTIWAYNRQGPTPIIAQSISFISHRGRRGHSAHRAHGGARAIFHGDDVYLWAIFHGDDVYLWAIFHGAMTSTCCHNAWQAPWINRPYLLTSDVTSLGGSYTGDFPRRHDLYLLSQCMASAVD